MSVYEILCDFIANYQRDLEDIMIEVNSKGASLTFLTERLTLSLADDATTTLMLQMMGSFAQFERSMIHKRQPKGIAAAKARQDVTGKVVYKGRKQSIDRDLVVKMIQAGSAITSISKALKISSQSIYRIKAEVGA